MSWEKKTTINIYSYCTHITLANDLLFLFFFLASLFLGNLRQVAQVFIHTRLVRANTITAEVKEKSVIFDM